MPDLVGNLFNDFTSSIEMWMQHLMFTSNLEFNISRWEPAFEVPYLIFTPNLRLVVLRATDHEMLQIHVDFE